MDIEGVPLIKQNRILVSRLAEAGLTPKDINGLNIPNLAKSTVYQYYDKWQNDEEFDLRNNGERPSKLTEEDFDLIADAIE